LSKGKYESRTTILAPAAVFILFSPSGAVSPAGNVADVRRRLIQTAGGFHPGEAYFS
jgi:hypothetical protein